MMNGKKTIEVRKNKALASAIQKLINENGYANIYVYCSKDKKYSNLVNRGGFITGMVSFKFRCYKVEEIKFYNYDNIYETDNFVEETLRIKSCLSWFELNEYLNEKLGYAIRISNLEIFDKPKELSEFKRIKIQKGCLDCPAYGRRCFQLDYIEIKKGKCLLPTKITKAPQNMVYVEVE